MSETQQMLTQLTQMLRDAGMPVTTDNLNRASLAVARGEMMSAEGEQPSAPRSVQTRRGVAPRSQANLPLPPEANPVFANVDAAMAEERPMNYPSGNQEPTAQPDPVASMENRAERVTASPEANTRRRGTINAAQPIVEDDPTGGMFEGNQPRQAVDVNDPVSLALALASAGLPLAGVGRAGMAAANAVPRVTAQSVRGDVATQTSRLIRGDREAVSAASRATRSAEPPAFVPPRGGSSAPVASPARPQANTPLSNTPPPMIPPQTLAVNTMRTNQGNAIADAMTQAFRNKDAATQARLLEAMRMGR